MIDLPENLAAYIVAIIGAASFAIVYRVPYRYLPATTLVGAAASLSIKSLPTLWHIGFSTFLTALFIGVLAHIFARYTKAPAQTFLLPGVIFLVPGTTIYRAFNAALDGNTFQATELSLAAVTISLGITFGLLIANWVIPTRKNL